MTFAFPESSNGWSRVLPGAANSNLPQPALAH